MEKPDRIGRTRIVWQGRNWPEDIVIDVNSLLTMEVEGTTRANVASLILHEARELRRKQDSRLEFHRRLSLFLLGGFLSAGTIAVAAAGEEAARVGGAVLWFGLPMAAVMMLSHRPIMNWGSGLSIRHLVDHYYWRGLERHRLETDLAQDLEVEYERNEELLSRVTLWVIVEFLLASAGTGYIIGVLWS